MALHENPVNLFENGLKIESCALSEGSHLGLGVFETFVARPDPERKRFFILGYKYHLERLSSGISYFNLKKIRSEEITELLYSNLSNVSLQESYHIRIIVFKEDWYLKILQFKSKYQKSLSVSVQQPHIRGSREGEKRSLLEVNEHFRPTDNNGDGTDERLRLSKQSIYLHNQTQDPLYSLFELKACFFEGTRIFPEFKHCSSILSVYASSYAQTIGCDEALLVNNQGEVTEGAWSNLFWSENKDELSTTEYGMLSGITRRIVIETWEKLGYTVKLKSVTPERLLAAHEVFLTQSTNGILPVVKINETVINTLSKNSAFIKLYNYFNIENIVNLQSLYIHRP
jgi:branched-subunit amino acid aminotransferase/4-amino-4-deoxychorismate lyase